MEPATFWTMISAIATAVSAIVIAWQSVLTRQSVKQAERSADASERAVTAVNQSLELAREQARHSELMSGEAIRSRMEAGAPSVFIAFKDRNEHGPKPFAYARSDSHGARYLQQVEPGEVFWDVRDDETWLFAVFRVRFENVGSVPVVVSPGLAFGYSTDGRLTNRLEQIRMVGGSQADCYLTLGNRAAEWIRATRANERTDVVAASSEWSADVEGETGVLIRQSFRIQGTLLESGPGHGAYSLREMGPDPNMNYPSKLVVDKQKRDYVAGRDQHGYPRLLPSPDLTRELS